MKNAILWNAILNGLTRVALVIGITYCAVYFRNLTYFGGIWFLHSCQLNFQVRGLEMNDVSSK